MPRLVQTVKVKNELGLHIRPAASIVKLLQKRQSDVYFTFNQETINARSIMSILMLVARKNAKITITIDGNDASDTMNDLLIAFEGQFGE